MLYLGKTLLKFRRKGFVMVLHINAKIIKVDDISKI